ncbi:shikimate kinase [Winogradskyella sp. DF17]|uniref:Shikimate kinase n=1 Tax=Winogradskyella pelagia TaxID=2819984 RepID=A0ABS3T521_9FLAO|nr:shikimate kinase [Winogradskyella sp. DF17]MBO3117847.1 shikimate kinase [Winogradskyella sp. DF17]
MIVVLIGYMGAGKTSVGKNLAKILDYNFFDLDDYISENEQVSIPEIFQKKGEIYFRTREAKYLRQLIASSEDIVLALGGGTPCYSENMTFLNNSNKINTFFLKLPLRSLVDRLIPEKMNRPLIAHLNTQEEFLEFIGKHLFERNTFYNMATYTVDCEKKTVQEISEDIVRKLV